MEDQDLTLGQLLTRGMRDATLVNEAPSPNEPAVQTRLQGVLSDLTLCASLISHLSILSANETIDDINTRDLRCVLVDALRGEMEMLVKVKGGKERMMWLLRAKEHFRTYLTLVDRYQIILDAQKLIFSGPQHATQDPTKRRELKIAQFKMEKEVKGKLKMLRERKVERRAQGSSLTASTSTSLSTASSYAPDDFANESDDDDSDTARPLYINLILLHYLKGCSELASIDQELELLQHNMAMSDLPSSKIAEQRGRVADRGEDENEEAQSWKLDDIKGDIRQGRLLDSQGKVLRPFTILPSKHSAMETRLRLQSEVFRQGHRLPTMTIDEFLEQEEANGNILQGGGPASSDAVEQGRKDKIAAEEDDTAKGLAREEAGLRKLREWDDYRDVHRKGEGNMHNRG